MSDRILCWTTGKLDTGDRLPLSGFFDAQALNSAWHMCGSDAVSAIDALALVLTADVLLRQRGVPAVTIATPCPDQARLIEAAARDLRLTNLRLTCSSESRSSESSQVIIDVSRLSTSTGLAADWWPSLTWWEREAVQDVRPGTWFWGLPGDIKAAAQEAPWAMKSLDAVRVSRVTVPLSRTILQSEILKRSAPQSREIDVSIHDKGERLVSILHSRTSSGPSLILCPLRRPPLVDAIIHGLPAKTRLSSNNAHLCTVIDGCHPANGIVSNSSEAIICARSGWLVIEPTAEKPSEDHWRSTVAAFMPNVCSFLTNLASQAPVSHGTALQPTVQMVPTVLIPRRSPLPISAVHKKKHHRKKHRADLLGTRVAGPAIVYKGKPAPSQLVLDAGMWGGRGADYDLAATLAAAAFIKQLVREGARQSDVLAVADTPKQSQLLTTCLAETGLGECRTLYEGVLPDSVSARGIVLVLARPVSLDHLLDRYEHLPKAPTCIVCHLVKNDGQNADKQPSRLSYHIVRATADVIAAMAGPDAHWISLPETLREAAPSAAAAEARTTVIGSMLLFIANNEATLLGRTVTSSDDSQDVELVIRLPRTISKLLQDQRLTASQEQAPTTRDHSAGSPAQELTGRHAPRHYDDADWFDTPAEQAAQERRQRGKITYTDVGIKRQRRGDMDLTPDQVRQLRKTLGTPGKDQ